MKLTRRSLLGGAGASLAGLAASGPLSKALADDPQSLVPSVLGPSVITAEPARVSVEPGATVNLFVSRVGKKHVGYGLEPGKPTIPGPTIEIAEGTAISINLKNDADQAVSFHPHGVDYSVASDGTAFNQSIVRPGKSRTYSIGSHTPSVRPDGTIAPGTAGYWHYHDHAMGTPHGTGGINAGLFGALIVRREDDPVPDGDPIVLVMKDNAFNLKRRTGMPASLDDSAPIIDNKTVGPADSFGFQVIVADADGNISEATQGAIARWKKSESAPHH